MNRNKLKTYAPAARRDFIQAMKDRAAFYGLSASKTEPAVVRGDVAVIAGRDHPRAIADKRKKLEARVEKDGFEQTMEAIAYTWFNRFVAIRFMELHGYLDHGYRVLSHPDGKQTPEILEHAEHVEFPGLRKDRVIDLKLDGNKDSVLYRLLLTAQCNALHTAMPFLFERIDDETELLLPDNLLHSDSLVRKLVDGIDESDWKEVEIIGWLYQFYISEKKDEVFAALKKNVKITSENIPAATQLFTPHWIVRYLVENSVGRLWMLNRPASTLAAKMDYYIAPEEPEQNFLRIARPEDIKVCDLACGSGHILTYAFDLLQTIYEEEGYAASEIPVLILTNNLYGIEIDERAGALAAFALSMKAAAKLGRRRFLRMEAKPDIVVLQDVRFTPTEMRDVAAVVGKDLFTDEFRETLGQFEQAKNFGSLIVPKLRDPAEALRVVEARDFSTDLLLKEVQERVVTVLRMAEVLLPQYHVAVANPPYMGGKGMNRLLSNFAKAKFPDSKADLFAMFMERALGMVMDRGMMAMINMQSWMFLSSYEKLRSKLLTRATILSMAHLGERAFDTIGGAVVSTTAFVVANSQWAQVKGDYIRLVDGSSESEKAKLFLSAIESNENKLFFSVPSEVFSEIPGNLITYWLSPAMVQVFSKSLPLSDEVRGIQGIITGDNNAFLRFWPEVSRRTSLVPPQVFSRSSADSEYWVPYTKGGEYRRWYGNGEYLLYWRDEGQQLTRRRSENSELYFQECISWNKISTRSFAARYLPAGYVWDVAGSSIFPNSQYDAKAFAGLMGSVVAQHILNSISPTLNFEMETVLGFPLFENAFEHHDMVVQICESIIQIARFDWDAYEISWDFTTLPLLSLDHRGATLEATYARLRAHWHGFTEEMRALEERNNRIFIDAYGLQNELTSELSIEEITLTCNPAYRYGVEGSEEDREARLREDTVAELLHYAVGCMFGRYSLDAPGLILANQGEGIEEYLTRVPKPTFAADSDNVIPVLDADWFADDIVTRTLKFLSVTFGEAKFRENLAFIEAALGRDIRRYFTNDFFSNHLRRYKKRPIYWLISSGKHRAFQCLIYLHRYNEGTLSRIRTEYVIPLQGKITSQIENIEGEKSKASSTSHRKKLQKEQDDLKKMQVELLSFDERLKHFADQKIKLDLDDGVKVNYGKFGDLLAEVKAITGGKEDE